MVDWNPFSNDGWDENDPWLGGKLAAPKPKPAPKKTSSTPLHGFSSGRPAFVDVWNDPKLSSAKALTPETPPPAPVKPGIKRILIIDDNLMVRRNHKLFLEKLGFEVMEAVDGKNGIDKMAYYGPETISLVLVDLNMPVMSGEEFVSIASSKFEKKMPPVWICTVSAEAETVKSLLSKGIAGYLLKPIQFRAFATKLQALFPDMELRIP